MTMRADMERALFPLDNRMSLDAFLLWITTFEMDESLSSCSTKRTRGLEINKLEKKLSARLYRTLSFSDYSNSIF